MNRSTFYLSLIFIMCCQYATAQIGVSARYQMNSTEHWNTSYAEVAQDGGNVLNSGFELGLSYWFRMKSKRLEFLPEISFAVASDGGLTTSTRTIDHSRTSINVNLNTLIYPFDFHSDCSSCPTFSKEGGLVKKGFYWIVSPGISMHNFSGTYTVGMTTTDISQDSQINFRLGLGAGLDIGVTNMMTISPFIMYSMNPGIDYDSLNTSLGVTSVDKCVLKQVHLGVRAIFRFDKNKW